MSGPINLRLARKRRARQAARAAGDAGAARHAVPKAARDAARAETSRSRQRLEGHLRETPRPPHDASSDDPAGG